MTHSPPPGRAVRNLLRNMAERNIAEHREGNLDQIRRTIRAELQRRCPDLSNDQIENRIDRRIRRGMQPTTATPLSPPAPVIAERYVRKARTKKAKGRR